MGGMGRDMVTESFLGARCDENSSLVSYTATRLVAAISLSN
jgi:hypothetical protein